MEQSANESTGPEARPRPEANFSSLVVSLAISAIEMLGGQPEDEDKDKPASPPQPQLARPMIDTLEVLKDKTRGNLTPEETGLLDSVLLDLRLRYLKATAAPQPAGTEPAAPSEDPPRGRIILP
jgi:hypothetical protein